MPRLHIRHEPDGIDAAHLADTMRSPGFARIQDRMREQREHCITALIKSETWEAARLLQGEIRAIERSIAIPEILRHEDLAVQRKNK